MRLAVAMRAPWLVALVALAPQLAGAVTVSASVDRSRLTVGVPAILSIEVRGTQNAAAPQLTGLDGFRVQYSGPATQMRFENGVTSRSVTHRYQLIPTRVGHFTLGPFAVDADGVELETEPIRVDVAKRGSPAVAVAGGSQLTLDAQIDDPSPYVGARTPLTIRLLIPQGVSVDDLQFPVVHAEGMSAGEMPQPDQRDERIGGRVFRVLHFNTYVTALRSAPTELTVSMSLSVLEQNRRGGRRGVFGMFGRAFAEHRPVEVGSQPLAVSPRPLPVAGRPAGFSGAVGTFDLSVAASPTKVNAGDPVTVQIVVRGDGDLTKLRLPRIGDTDGLKVYEPLPIKGLGDDAKGIEQVVIPQSPEVTEVPAVQLSFFDPEKEVYRTLRRGPIGVQVGAAVGAPAAVVAQGDTGRAEKVQGPLGRDIVFIKRSPGSWSAVGATWWGSWLYWAINALPLLAGLAVWWRSRRAGLLAANPKLRRFREAGAVARSALSAIDAHKPGFLDGLSTALSVYLAAKLDLPPGAIEAERVYSALVEAGCGDAVADAARGFFADVEALRYAPGAGAEEDRRGLLQRGEAIVAALEARPALEKQFARLAVVLLGAVAAGLIVWSGVAAADDVGEAGPEASFFAGNMAYTGGRYDDAVDRYEEVLVYGVESGALYFNLGNAQFKRGDPAAAVASYRRAARLLPRDPDIAANLSFAGESLELAEDLDPLWRRVVFAIAYRASAAELALGLALAWWALCAIVVAGVLVRRYRDQLRGPAWGMGVLVIVLLANFYYRGSYLELWRDAVVTGTEDVTVRFEPAADGTAHFVAPLGSSVTVREERDGWALVSRKDGQRGWVEQGHITRLR